MNKKQVFFNVIGIILFSVILFTTSISNAVESPNYLDNQYNKNEMEMKYDLAEKEIFQRLRNGKIDNNKALEELQFLNSIKLNFNKKENSNKILLKEEDFNPRNTRYNEYCKNFLGVCDGTGQNCYDRNHHNTNHHNINNNRNRDSINNSWNIDNNREPITNHHRKGNHHSNNNHGNHGNRHHRR